MIDQELLQSNIHTSMVHPNGERAQSIVDNMQLSQSNAAIARLSRYLAIRAKTDFRLDAFLHNGAIESVEMVFRGGGSGLWALSAHAQRLAQVAGLAGESPLFTADSTITGYDAVVGDFEYQARPFLLYKEGCLPVAMATHFVDVALEHAICVGIAEQGLTWNEWSDLKDGGRMVSIDAYLNDLNDYWANPALLGSAQQRINTWPLLVDRELIGESLETYSKLVELRGLTGEQSAVMSGGMRIVLGEGAVPTTKSSISMGA